MDSSRISEGWGDVCPPLFVESLETFDDFRMIGEDVVLLFGIFLDGVEFVFGHAVFALVADETPLVGHDRGFSPLDGIFDALAVGYENAVRPTVGALGRLDERADGNAVELYLGRGFDASEVDQCRDNVDVSGDGLDLVFLVETAAGPVKEEGDAVATVVFAALGAAHAKRTA